MNNLTNLPASPSVAGKKDVNIQNYQRPLLHVPSYNLSLQSYQRPHPYTVPSFHLYGPYGWKEKRIRKSSKSLVGGCAHGINGILTSAMNDSETIGLGGYRLSLLRTHCSTSQNPVILFLI